MKFTNRKKRQAPAVIIISLIDILIVLLIFLMVTTTFKNQPAVKLTLPESHQAKQGSSENLIIVTIAKAEPYLFLDTLPVTLTKLQEELNRRAAANPKATLAIRPDKDAPFGEVMKVFEAAQAAKLKTSIPIFVKPAGK
jgi:biopolymer transport protein ExbD